MLKLDLVTAVRDHNISPVSETQQLQLQQSAAAAVSAKNWVLIIFTLFTFISLQNVNK